MFESGQGLGGIASIPLQSDGSGMMGLLFISLYLVFLAVVLAGWWKTFEKAGQPGWAVLVPIYNVYVLVVGVAGRDMLWFLLSLFIPFAILIPMLDVAKSFGRGTGFGFGLFFLGFIFFPILGFSDDEYLGPAAA